jgi:hypothetical protein
LTVREKHPKLVKGFTQKRHILAEAAILCRESHVPRKSEKPSRGVKGMDRTVTQPGHSEIASSAPTISVQRPAMPVLAQELKIEDRKGIV